MRDEAEHKGDSKAVGVCARRCRDAEGVRLRRAEAADVDFVTGLLGHREVEPYLSLHRGREREDVLERIVLSQRAPASAGVFVIEAAGAPRG